MKFFLILLAGSVAFLPVSAFAQSSQTAADRQAAYDRGFAADQAAIAKSREAEMEFRGHNTKYNTALSP